MDREFLYHLLLYIGIEDPEDYIDHIPRTTIDVLIAQLTPNEIDEILEEIKNKREHNAQ